MSNINVLFYSLQCTTSRHLLTVLKNENLTNYFKMVCVDNILDKLPQQINQVPTMILNGINKPFVAEEIFEWINQVKFLKSQNNSVQSQQQNINPTQIDQPIKNNNANNTNNTILFGYDKEIMGSLSDKFAATKFDNALPQSYFGVGDENKNAIFTAPEQKPISKEEQNKKIREMEQKRNLQDSEYFSGTKKIKVIKKT